MESSKIILITGTSRGIGKHIAQYLEKQGHIVYGSSRNIPNSTTKNYLELDVTKFESCLRAVERILAEHGRIDVLINNAGYHLMGGVAENTLEELHHQMNTNFYGVANMTNAVLPVFLEQKGGKIITIGSLGGFISLPYASAYSASKFALEGYTEALRLELLPFGIFVSNIEPGIVNTGTRDHSMVNPKKSVEPFSNFRNQIFKQMDNQTDKGISLQTLAEVTGKIIESEKPKFRYKIGNAVKILPLLKALLPQTVFENMVLNNFRLPKKVIY